jgi:hypothetical protein
MIIRTCVHRPISLANQVALSCKVRGTPSRASSMCTSHCFNISPEHEVMTTESLSRSGRLYLTTVVATGIAAVLQSLCSMLAERSRSLAHAAVLTPTLTNHSIPSIPARLSYQKSLCLRRCSSSTNYHPMIVVLDTLVIIQWASVEPALVACALMSLLGLRNMGINYFVYYWHGALIPSPRSATNSPLALASGPCNTLLSPKQLACRGNRRPPTASITFGRLETKFSVAFSQLL